MPRGGVREKPACPVTLNSLVLELPGTSPAPRMLGHPEPTHIIASCEEVVYLCHGAVVHSDNGAAGLSYPQNGPDGPR